MIDLQRDSKIYALARATTMLSIVSLLLLAARQAQAQATPVPTFSNVPLTLTITGNVSSGTAGLSVPSGLQLTLHVAHPQAAAAPSESVKQDTALAADGSFKFENVLALPGDIALVTTTFQGVLQGTTPVQLTNGQSTLETVLTLYGVTTDASAITLVSVQHLLDFGPGTMQVLATYDYQNNSDRIYVSQAKTDSGLPISVRVPLPVGAGAVAFNQQTAFTLGGDINAPIVQDTEPIVPGRIHKLLFSYQVPYTVGAPIDQDYPYNTTSISILIPDDARTGLSNMRIGAALVPADQLSTTSNTTINPKRTYSQYTLKTPLMAGDRLIYFLGKGGPPSAAQPAAAPSGVGLNLLGVVLLGTMILIVIGGAFILRRPAKKPMR
jgi:hypothetical protein